MQIQLPTKTRSNFQKEVCIEAAEIKEKNFRASFNYVAYYEHAIYRISVWRQCIALLSEPSNTMQNLIDQNYQKNSFIFS